MIDGVSHSRNEHSEKELLKKLSFKIPIEFCDFVFGKN